jgi:hypothetical protein
MAKRYKRPRRSGLEAWVSTLPENRLFTYESDRKAAARDTASRLKRNPVYWLSWVAGFALAALATDWLVGAISAGAGLPAEVAPWLELAVWALFAAALLAMTPRIFRNRAQRLLRQRLRGAGVAVCEACGGLTDGAEPRCVCARPASSER